MLRREVAISAADVRLLRDNVEKLGDHALRLVGELDLGLDAGAFHDLLRHTGEQLAAVAADREGFPVRLRPEGYTDRGLLEHVDLPWNYPQTMRFASGACMISQKYLRWMRPQSVKHSLVAKVLYKCQTGILDDLVDKADYSYLEAKGLYHLVLSSMTDPALDTKAYMKRLMSILRQDQLGLFDLVTAITSNFNVLFTLSPHGSDFFYQMELLDERVALGQALTMFQKESHLDLGQVANISRGFSFPPGDLPWYERLANHISGGTRYNLIDVSFMDRVLKPEKLESLVQGWSFLDVAIVFLNNVVNVYEDLHLGIANLSLAAMREKEVLPLTTLRGYDPQLTLEDYGAHLARLAELASQGLDILGRTFPDPDQYYPFIAVMMPMVMLAEWIGKNDEMILRYLEPLAPALRRAVERSERVEDERVALPRPARPRAR